MSENHIAEILERKRREVSRRRTHRANRATLTPNETQQRADGCYRALARAGAVLPRVIAEIKHRSPSAGVIRMRRAGGVADLARAYAGAGAAAVSVLCDGPGFGGTPLDVRRAAAVVDAPVLFKEFVLDEVQVAVAREMGASMVLLLVRALSPQRLKDLVDCVHAYGMAPVVEAADAAELATALTTDARIVGVNARDLRTFLVDGAAARALVNEIPADRIAVYMSGVRSRNDLHALCNTRTDAALVGEGLMGAADPGAELTAWLLP